MVGIAALFFSSPVITGMQTKNDVLAKQFVDNCRQEIKQLENDADTTTDNYERALICEKAFDKAMQCQREAIENFPYSSELPKLGADDLGETTNMLCHCKSLIADKEEELDLAADPVRKWELLQEKLEITFACHQELNSAIHDSSIIPRLGGDDLGETTNLEVNCEKIIMCLKANVETNEGERREKIIKKLLEIEVTCIQTWQSVLFDSSRAPKLGEDHYGVRDYFVEDCETKINNAETQEEKQKIRQQCESALELLYPEREKPETNALTAVKNYFMGLFGVKIKETFKELPKGCSQIKDPIIVTEDVIKVSPPKIPDLLPKPAEAPVDTVRPPHSQEQVDSTPQKISEPLTEKPPATDTRVFLPPKQVTPPQQDPVSLCSQKGGTWDSELSKCVKCPSGTVYQGRGQCGCPGGQVMFEGKCIPPEQICSIKSMSTQPKDWSSYVLSELNKHRCVSGARISGSDVLKINTAKGVVMCYSSQPPKISVNSEVPVCKGTPCGDVACDKSKSCSCGERCTVTVDCLWGGWKKSGSGFVPMLGSSAKQ